MYTRTYVAAFDDPVHARLFVEKVHLKFPRDVSTFLEKGGLDVFVFDSTKKGARVEIMRLARNSSASKVRMKGIVFR